MKLGTYLKYKWKTVAAFVLFAVVFTVTLALYKVPPIVLWYPMLICTVTGIIFVLVGYLRTRKSCEYLNLVSRMRSEIIDNLPQPSSPEDEAYQKIIRTYCAEELEAENALIGKYNDMIDYYSMWAHQIKTPIASMRLNLQNEDSRLSRQLQQDLNRIDQYVDMVMTYLRLDSKDTDYVIRECDLDSIVRPVVRKYAGDFIGRKLTLEYEPLNMKVLSDEKWLGFVIEQLLSNALKYTREGGVRIYMDGSDLCISDTGIGIDAADLPRIFEKGFTGFNGRQDRKASGIGLYLCKRICENLGHKISAESGTGRGTTVRINLARRKLGIE